jgi:glutathione S-transferase
MHSLTHFRFCPFSRSIRLLLAEIEVEPQLVEERPWEWRSEFLQLNPAGELPVLELDGGPILCGYYPISEFIGEELRNAKEKPASAPLFPGGREARAEVRRLVAWFHGKLYREATEHLIASKIWCHFKGAVDRTPDSAERRAVKANLRYHMSYIAWLADDRNWLAGDELSFADIAAAAQLSCLDYVDEVPWDEYSAAKNWYMRVKSRRSFRPLLADRVPGAAPAPQYADLDF